MTSFDVTYFANGTRILYGDVDRADVFVKVGTTTIEVAEEEVRASLLFVLKQAFYRLNRVTEDNYDPMLDERKAPSCSVSDVLVFAEGAFVVRSIGFDCIPGDLWRHLRKIEDAPDVTDKVIELREAMR